MPPGDGFEHLAMERSTSSVNVVRTESWKDKSNLLDLPNEILAAIGELVCQQSGYSVQNLRLTCWQLCNAVSHHLIHRVTVRPSRASLAGLVEISQHPTISKGVTSIRIDLRLYNRKITSSFQTFVEYNAKFLYSMPPRPSRAPSIPKHPHMVKFEEKCDIWASWRAEDTNREAALPEEAYAEYIRLLEDQEATLAAGNFTHIVAAAWARMSLVESLHFSDDDYITEYSSTMWESIDVSQRIGDRRLFGGNSNRPQWWMEKTDAERALLYFSLLPSSWDVPYAYEQDIPPIITLLYKLPGAIQTRLLNLRIRLSRPEYFLNLAAPSGEELVDLTRSISKLETFALSQPDTSLYFGYLFREIERTAILNTLSSAILNTNSLEEVTIQFENIRRTKWCPEMFCFESIVQLRQWPNLYSLNLVAVPLQLANLQQILDCFPMLEEILLEEIALLSGTVSDMLDILRSKDLGYVSILAPYSNEDDEGWMREPDVFEDAFDVERGESKAQAYVLGKLDVNPLRRKPGTPDSLGF